MQTLIYIYYKTPNGKKTRNFSHQTLYLQDVFLILKTSSQGSQCLLWKIEFYFHLFIDVSTIVAHLN